MSLLGGLFKNKAMQAVMQKQLESTFKEEGIKAVVLNVDENGQFKTQLFKEEVRVLPEKEYQNLMTTVKNIL